MQSTPVRVSVAVLGTVTALTAYGLGRTSASTADTSQTPSNSPTKPKSSAVSVQPVDSIAVPETIAAISEAQTFQFTPLPSTHKQNQPPLKPASQQNTPVQPKISRIRVDQIPIDQIIAASLFSQSVPEPKAKPKAKPAKPLAVRPSSPLPAQSAPEVPATQIDDASYTLGAGDRIRVELFNVPEYSREYQVLVNGIVNLYLVGPLSVRGMTPLQAQAAIAAKYAPIVDQPRIDVTLLAARPVRVAIAGEINRPGTYVLTTQENSSFPTLTQLIQQAGGITQAANARKVAIRRPQAGGTALTIQANLWELTQTGDLRQDLTLRDGDSIVIPTNTDINLAEASQLATANFASDSKQALNITVVGEVMRPGPIVLAATTGGLPTLSQAIQQAGGITALANVREVEVRRSTRTGTTQTKRLNLWQLLSSGDATQDLVLQQGDTIVIPKGTALTAAEVTQVGGSTFAPTAIRVNIVGEVESPGAVQVPPNSPLNQALLSAGGFNRRANRRSVQLLRLNPDGTVSRQAIAIDFARGIDEKGNPILRNNDVILVDRSGGAKLEDSLDRVGGFLGKILPFGFFLR
ncbi:SLBB domain-containing protein [Leptolyngbya sp. GGD]|uniref:SLBB domain-containing protein n=1 Tax=Leptolyngbya sp. GGD TaxID=2997907 RepID=UPI00227A6DDE|nr:SLBB domain-containing protein [Leptolyngbya sp. GGD]MCY6489290.1 SLBB domain-containing protein [Leptolyngbya sp. GGD]